MKTFAACSTLALGLLGLAPHSVAAQATVPVWREIVVYASDAAYPQALAGRGVQGEATIEVTPGANGAKPVAVVRDSSRSPELDALALRMASHLNIKGTRGAGSGLVVVSFRKDHSTTIATKSCADFNADAAYQSATFPERKLRELPVVVASLGMLVYSMHRDGSAGRSFPAVESILNATVAACARTPQSGMLDVMRQEALKLIDP